MHLHFIALPKSRVFTAFLLPVNSRTSDSSRWVAIEVRKRGHFCSFCKEHGSVSSDSASESADARETKVMGNELV